MDTSVPAYRRFRIREPESSYSVRLNPSTADAIQTDLAATTRTGIAAFTYPQTSAANVLFKMGASQSGNKTADVRVVGDHSVTGTETAGQFCGSGGTYPVHFAATFDQPFASHGTWHTAPTGDNLFAAPTGQLDWGYHEVAGGGTPATVKPATTSDGRSAVSWQQANALATTWIQATPPALTPGTFYRASVTLQGSGKVYLNFYNGRQDVGGDPVTLTSTPVTVTADATVPTGSIGAPQFQVRTPGAGPVDVLASAVSVRAESVVETNAAGSSGLGSGAWVSFNTQKQTTVRMKVALSYVSTDEAWANLAKESPGWSVPRVAAATPGTPGLALGAWGTGAADEPPSYPAGPLQFPPGRKPTVLVPTGPNLLGTAATGDLSWQGPVQNGVGSVPGTITPTTTPAGAGAIHWTETNAAPDTWIWVDPPAPLTAGQSYQVSITLEGHGTVFLDFWNGQSDLASARVGLTATPQTLTVQGAVPSAADTHLQIRTADTGPVDLDAGAASIRQLVTQTDG